LCRLNATTTSQDHHAEYLGSSDEENTKIMKPIPLSMLLSSIGIAASESTNEAVVTNLSTANWTREEALWAF
jgi:hypothetical protein